jgi:hypothetical protein
MRRTALLFSFLLFLYSCQPGERENNVLFSLMSPSSTHVKFENRLNENQQFNIIEYLYFNNGAGVAAGDINNDGLVDLYFTSSQNSNKLYLNKGNLQFEDITDKAGVAGTGNWKTGVTMADVNGDGLLDIYVCEVGAYKAFNGRNQLFINQGDLTFKEESHEYGLDFQGFSTQAAFFDYDMDGDLDMYLLNHSVHTSRSYGGATLRNEKDTLAGDRLYRNDNDNGKHVFHEVTRSADIFSSQIGYGLGVNICDINNDGYPDIYVSNDFHENDYLYINNGNGTFTEKLTSQIAHTSRSSMGNDVGDFNNDGNLDVMVLDMLPDEENIRKQSGGEDDYELFTLKLKYGYGYQFVRNTLQLNLGDGLFSEIGRLSGVYSTDWSWSPLFCDVDNDGWKDLFITNGIYRRANDLDYVKFLTGGSSMRPVGNTSDLSDKVLYEKMPLYPHINYLFRNNGDLTFTNKAQEWGFKTKSYSNGATYADLDNDGDLDLIINNINDKAFIYRNNSNTLSDNHYLSVVLKGNGLNKRGLGARVTVYCNGNQQVAEQFPTRGFMSSTSDVLHFGLGSSSAIDSLIVRWPDLSTQTLKEIPSDQILTLNQQNAGIKHDSTIKGKKIRDKIFGPTNIPGLNFKHTEDSYADFYRERLIPHSLSSEGPALAVCDVNNDGLEDVFTGGAKNQPSSIFIQKKDGSFSQSTQVILIKQRYTEDVDAAFFDADGDGDKDLYIVRGGNEIRAGNPLLTDIILINDGKGNFVKGKLPYFSHNGSCIAPCDFDNDGDIDLFVGSRSLPGAYGWPPDQYLLKNDGHGNFTDVTEQITTGMRKIGMVTDAEWFDYDNDGDMDLVLTGEWMNVTIFRNDNGHFDDATVSAGLDSTSGWWNCITVADIDGDGDMDMICGNLGLNSIMKASKAEPVTMYLNDFDKNGSLDQVICSYENGISYPVASLDEMVSQINGLDKKYPKYSDFGGQTAEDIFGKAILEKSVVKKAFIFESSAFINNGNGTFTQKKLPVYAQFSPVRDITVEDIAGNGISNILLIGNDYAVRPSYGRYDASYGWYLQGEGGHTFKTLMPSESGFAVRGDSRKIKHITIKGTGYLLVAVNNDSLRCFKVNCCVKNPFSH